MENYSKPLALLIDELVRLPGIGPKTAQRLAFHIIEDPGSYASDLARAIKEAKSKVRFCRRCFNLSTDELCSICSDARRSQDTICVVQEVQDVIAIEKTGQYEGLYHVLGGAIAPLSGVGSERLRIAELIERVGREQPGEIILATNANLEGEQTALFLAQKLRGLPVKVSRIASGLPIGGEIEYADEITITKALESRREV